MKSSLDFISSPGIDLDPHIEISAHLPGVYGAQLTLSRGGQDLLSLSKSELLELFADEHNVSVSQLRSWRENNGRIRCSATSKRGGRCKCCVKGMLFYDPHEWAKADLVGGYCFSHGKEY